MHLSLPLFTTGLMLRASTASPASQQNTTLAEWDPAEGTVDWWWSAYNASLQHLAFDYFYDGSPHTLQWISAFLDTLLSASEETLLVLLQDVNTKAIPTNISEKELESGLVQYISMTLDFYDNEDTIQIFDAAYDDVQWVVLEWLEGIKLMQQYNIVTGANLSSQITSDFAHRAHVFYNVVQDKFNKTLCDGGLTWNPALPPYKNSITNELFITSSVNMYLFWPGDNNSDPYPNANYTAQTNITLPDLPYLETHNHSLLQNAITTYDWFLTHNFTNAQGLIVDGYHIPQNQTACDVRSDAVYTYNQGVILSGLRRLWEATGNASYLRDGYDLISIVISATGWVMGSNDTTDQWSGLGRHGVIEDYCDSPGTCDQSAEIFKGVYFHHLTIFCEPLPTAAATVPDISYVADQDTAAAHASFCSSITPWVDHNAKAALSTVTSGGYFGGWWNAAYYNNTQQPTPPQPMTFGVEMLDMQMSQDKSTSYKTSSRGANSTLDAIWTSAARRVGPEIDGSGVSVVKAALDFKLRYPSS